MSMRLTTAAIVVLSLVIIVGCSKGGVEIYAPPQFGEGDVIVDGIAATKLSKPRHNYRWRGWSNVRDELSAPPRHESYAAIAELTPGLHEISVVKKGYLPLTVRFNHKPGTRSVVDVWSAKVQETSPSAPR